MYRPPSWLRIAILCLILAGIAAASAAETAKNAQWIGDLIGRFGPFVPLIFVLVHVAASLLFVPRSVMALVAATLFGFWPACLWATVGSTAGAVTGFLIARYVNAGLIVPEELSKVGPALRQAEAGGWRAVAIVRLVPFFPHALTNYALGLTGIGLLDYTLGSLAGMAPETYVFVNLAVTGRRAFADGAWVEPALWGLALLALSFVPKLLRRLVR